MLRGLLVALALLAAGCAVPVAGALDEADANRVVIALDGSGIDAAKEVDPTTEGKFRVLVARDDVGRALATMREEELPRPKSRGVAETTDRGQLVPSQAAEHAQLVAGLAGDLEKTLASIDGILSARVHLNVPAREPLRDGPPAKSTGSVLVEHRGATPPIAPESIQRLISGGAPGVAPADVAVVFVPRAARGGGGRTDLAHVGPITVARGSVTVLRVAAVASILVLLALVGAIVALWAKLGRLRRDHDAELAAAQVTRGPRSVHPTHSALARGPAQ